MPAATVPNSCGDDMMLPAGEGKEQAKFVEGISSEDLVVAGIASDSEVNDCMHNSVVIIVVMSFTVAPESHKLIDAM